MNLERLFVTPHGQWGVTNFTDELMSKNQWSMMLGVDERSLQRWEREIIDSTSLKFAYHYPLRKRHGVIYPNPLDGYRRFMLLTIYQLKHGRLEDRAYLNSESVAWLESRKKYLGRTKFDYWRKEHGIY